MAESVKTEVFPELNEDVLPRGLDVLDPNEERSNLPIAEIFKRYPSMSMIAQILTDFIVSNGKVRHDDIQVSLYERGGISGLAFSAKSMRDGSIDDSIHDALFKSFAAFQQTIDRHGLETGNQVSLYAENFFIGSGNGPDKIGLVAFLYALSQDYELLIGPDIEGERKPSIGAFTLNDIVHALQDEGIEENRLREEFEKACQDSEGPQPLSEQEDMDRLMMAFTAAAVRGIDSNEFAANLFQTSHGRSLVLISNLPGDSVMEKIDGFLSKVEPLAEDGVGVSREISGISIRDLEAFRRFVGRVVELYPAPAPTPQEKLAERPEQDDAPSMPFWNRAVPTTPIETIVEALHGLARFHYEAGDHAEWLVDFSEGMWRISAMLPKGLEGFASNLEDMLRDLREDGGDWENLSILPTAYTVEFRDPRTFSLMLQQYEREKNIYSGEAALKLCDTIHYDEEGKLVASEQAISLPFDEDEIDHAAFLVEEEDPEAEGISPEEAAPIDPSILHLLGDRQYSSKEDLIIDVARLNRLIDSEFYSGPYGSAEIFESIRRRSTPIAKPSLEDAGPQLN